LTADNNTDKSAQKSALQHMQTVQTAKLSQMQDAVTSQPLLEQLAETMFFLLARNSAHHQHQLLTQLQSVLQLQHHQHQQPEDTSQLDLNQQTVTVMDGQFTSVDLTASLLRLAETKL